MTDFGKNVKKYSAFKMRCDQTTQSTIQQKVSLERGFPYLSYDTVGFEICTPVRSQWPRENHGPVWTEAKSE